MTIFDHFDHLRDENFQLGNEMDVGFGIPQDVVSAITEYLDTNGGQFENNSSYECSDEMVQESYR